MSLFKTVTFGAGVGVGTAAYYLIKKKYPDTPNYYSAIAGAALLGASAFGFLTRVPVPEEVEEVLLGAGYALIGVSAITAALRSGATATATAIQVRQMSVGPSPMVINRMMPMQGGLQVIQPGESMSDTPTVY